MMIALTAALHVYFMVLEMFFWDKTLGMHTFGIKPEFAKTSKVIAANQGLYNGFIAAGLIWESVRIVQQYFIRWRREQFSSCLRSGCRFALRRRRACPDGFPKRQL